MKGANPTTTLLRNARIVLPERTAENASLLIRHGRIDRISEADARMSPSAESTIDFTGLTVYPGFIDLHIHGAIGVDTMAANAQDLRRVSQFLATHGVTGWLPTFVPAPDSDYAHSIGAIAEAMEMGDSPTAGARILGVHY